MNRVKLAAMAAIFFTFSTSTIARAHHASDVTVETPGPPSSAPEDLFLERYQEWYQGRYGEPYQARYEEPSEQPALQRSEPPAVQRSEHPTEQPSTVLPPKPSQQPSAEPSFFVSRSGSDAGAGSRSSPWRTVGRAVRSARAGDTVMVLGGSYAEDVKLSGSGGAGAPITFVAAEGEAVSVRSLNVAASHVVVAGIAVAGASGSCVTVQPGLREITLRGARISGCGRDGVQFVRAGSRAYTSGVVIEDNVISAVGRSNSSANALTIHADNVTVQNNDITQTPNDAINMWGDRHTYRANTIHDISNTTGNHNDAFQTWTGLGDGAEGKPVTNLLIERNVIRNILGSSAHVIMSEGPGHANWTIRNNFVQRIGDQAFIFAKQGNGSQGIPNILVARNTFVSAGSNSTMEFNLNSSGKVVNNIFFDCRGWGGGVAYYEGSAASVSFDYNLAGGTSKRLSEPNAKFGDPKFVDLAAGNVRLQATSLAINAADDSIAAQDALDLYGNTDQGVSDIGAAEHQG